MVALNGRGVRLLQSPEAEWQLSVVGPERLGMQDQDALYRCSFCKKDNHQVARMVAGPKGAFICDECIRRANAILESEAENAPGR